MFMSELFVLTYPCTGGTLLCLRQHTSQLLHARAMERHSMLNAVSASSLEQSHDCMITAVTCDTFIASDALGSSSSSIPQHLRKASFAGILLL
jgi:hypothetical protein